MVSRWKIFPVSCQEEDVGFRMDAEAYKVIMFRVKTSK